MTEHPSEPTAEIVLSPIEAAAVFDDIERAVIDNTIAEFVAHVRDAFEAKSSAEDVDVADALLALAIAAAYRLRPYEGARVSLQPLLGGPAGEAWFAHHHITVVRLWSDSGELRLRFVVDDGSSSRDLWWKVEVYGRTVHTLHLQG